MTAARPIRHRSFATASDTDDLAQAEADVASARDVATSVRRRITRGEDGAASLAAAEYRLALALDKLAALGGTPPPSFPSAEPEDAA